MREQLSTDPVEGFAFFEESIELSRRCRALKLWLSLRYHGLAAFRAAIRRDLDHAQRSGGGGTQVSGTGTRGGGRAERGLLPASRAGKMLRRRTEPVQHGIAETDDGARAGVSVECTLQGKFCLRACIVNHLTKESDIDAVVPEVLAAAEEIRRQVRG